MSRWYRIGMVSDSHTTNERQYQTGGSCQTISAIGNGSFPRNVCMRRSVRMRSHIIVSGDDALATTIVEELNNAGAHIVKLTTAAELADAEVARALAVDLRRGRRRDQSRNRAAGKESQPERAGGRAAGQ